jgi:hypothetical protein
MDTTITGIIRNTTRLNDSASGNPRYSLAIESGMGHWHETRRYSTAKDSQVNYAVQSAQGDGSMMGGPILFTIVDNEITDIKGLK